MAKRLLSLFDYTGTWSQPYRDAGWEVVQTDIKIPAWIPCECDEFYCTLHDMHACDCECPPLDDVPEWDPYGENDILRLPLEEMGGIFDGILCAVPCTDFARSGSKHWRAKDEDGRTAASIHLVKRSLEIINYYQDKGLQFWVLENPMGRIAKLVPELGKPAYWFNPCDYGDNYTKRTYLWGKFAPPMALYGEGVAIPVPAMENHLMRLGGKSEKTKTIRSKTPEKFAKAFYVANH